MPDTLTMRPGPPPTISFPAPSSQQLALEAAFPVFGFPHLIPTVAEPMVARRIPDGSTAKGAILVRVLTDVLQGAGGICFDEYIYRNPDGYSGVNAGWQLWSWRAVAGGKVKRWLVGPASRGAMPTVEFAFRTGLRGATYHSGGEGPDFYYRGFGHGGMTTGGASISLNGGGSNLDSIANWALNTDKRGSLLTIATTYQIKLGATDVADITLTLGLDNTGLREFGTIVAENDVDFSWQDSYLLMMPFSRYDIDRFKPAGDTAAVVDLVTPDTGYPATTATVYQAYKAAESTIIPTCELVYSQPVRRGDGSLAAWALNHYGRALIRNIAGTPLDYPKGYVLAASSEEGLPRTAWPLTGTYEWQNRRRTHYRAGGPL